MPDLCRAYLHSFGVQKKLIDKTKRIVSNAQLSTGRYDDEYKRMCEGDFNLEVFREPMLKVKDN